nr:hypothetical protein [Tanacetum cinerariifolium]
MPTNGPAIVEMVNATKESFDEDDLAKFQELLLDVEKPLYKGCPDLIKLSAIVKLLNLKGKYEASDNFFTELLGLLKRCNLLVKDKQEKDTIGTKPDENGKRGRVQQCQSPVTVEKAEKRRNTDSRDQYWQILKDVFIQDKNKEHYEAVNEEMYDSLERDATTVTRLDAEQDRGDIFKTQAKATPNEPVSQGTSLGGGPGCQEAIGDAAAQIKYERVSKISNDLLLVKVNTPSSRE